MVASALFVLPANVAAQPSGFAEAMDLIAAGENVAALEMLTPLADAGNAEAAYQVGELYLARRGVDFEPAEAARYFRMAIEGNVLAAYHALATLHVRGQGVEQDFVEAVRLERIAADQGYSPSQLSLGLRYLNGEGVEQDLDLARMWFETAVEGGNAAAAYQLGLLYANGTGVEQDFERALEWTRIAAEGGFVGGHFNLGVAYDLGQGVDRDPALSFYHFLIAFFLSGQPTDGPLFAAANDMARQLTIEERDALVEQAQAWVAEFDAAAAE